MNRSRLPASFLWGSATAAHQVEGANANSDCWALEHASPSLFAEPSGDAVDHWHRFEADLDIVQALELNAFRFSIEWARVEPEPGLYSRAALDHYKKVIAACRSRGVAPVVTFHHFTQPLWMARLGGFGSSEFPTRFADYCAVVAAALDGIAVGCTINELNLPLAARRYFHGLLDDRNRAAAERALGAPIDAFFLFAGDHVLENGLAAHRASKAAIRSERGDLPIGMTLAISEETALPGAEAQRDARLEQGYVPFLDAAGEDDFVGVQTYARMMSSPDGSVGPAPGADVTTMGWEDRPQAIGNVCRWIASRWAVPMIITENGYPGENDDRREAFIEQAIASVRDAVRDGAQVRGYFYWSLLDNFEWMLGYRQKFGLVGVDRSSMDRTVKPSGQALHDIIAASSAELRAYALANCMIC